VRSWLLESGFGALVPGGRRISFELFRMLKDSIRRLRMKVRVIRLLGFSDVARVGLYRLGLELGVHPVLRIAGAKVHGPFFTGGRLTPTGLVPSERWQSRTSHFGWAEFEVNGDAPDWFVNPFNSRVIAAVDRSWSQIKDFDSKVGDIKAVWEASRFDWVTANAQRAREGDVESLCRLNRWLDDWTHYNPAFHGPNWKCGQEAALRVLQLAAAAQILGEVDAPLEGLQSLVRVHLLRITPTVSYAIGQSNNHGTSEAAALFVGGSWLESLGDPEGKRWEKKGRGLLEDRARRLVEVDGTFSQYSMNYHRVFIDTMAMAEQWRSFLNREPFSEKFGDQCAAATRWLYSFVDPSSGDVPNIGANDGASILTLGDHDFRDFRPSVQRAAALFCAERAFEPDLTIDSPARWLGVELPTIRMTKALTVLRDDGGFGIVRHEDAFAVLRYPRFRHRPSQCDVLHLDLWVHGKPILKDGGTYSYAANDDLYHYFAGVEGHNTVAFDGNEQMPRLGRFLFGDWLESSGTPSIVSSDDQVSISAGYTTRWRGSHERKVQLKSGSLSVTDRIAGFEKEAVLRWRLAAGSWTMEANVVRSDSLTIKIEATMPISRIRIVNGWESLYYLDRKPSPVLEVRVEAEGTVTSSFVW
jgi:Heparinase II/III-like protein/Heparinase II/III N-terminus